MTCDDTIKPNKRTNKTNKPMLQLCMEIWRPLQIPLPSLAANLAMISVNHWMPQKLGRTEC